MSRGTIQNPILKGFNPDPSICRAGDDYYIATSTFEWFPGVQIHHSRDLVNWRLACRPLTRPEQLDMRGEADSCGVWAPCLTYADGVFWLIYSDVKRREGSVKDVHNYLVTATNIEGPWSDPIYLNSSGFDPSLFHDDDGRKWLVNVLWDYRGRPPRFPGDTCFGGIACQEFDVASGQLVGPIHNIFRGSATGMTEGPHVYKRDGYYYCMVAEGGTGYAHAATLGRSTSLTGPYELHPDWYVVTTRGAHDSILQRCGHGDFVETADGETYIVHLCGRPIPGLRRSPLGRETSIQKVEWHADGWPRLVGTPMTPRVEVEGLDVPAHPFPAEPERYSFTPAGLPDAFQWLRTPYPDRLFSLTARPGFLRLYGREAIGGWYEQSLVARRQVSFDYDAETEVFAEPTSHLQLAGLAAYYNRFAFHYLALTFDEAVGSCLQVISCNGVFPGGHTSMGTAHPVPVPSGVPIRMKAEVRGTALRFYYAVPGGDWTRVGAILDASLLSDECGPGEHGNFTGAFVGMAANDMGGLVMPADFSHFVYRNRDQ
jgi:xylan 1,4-beta-xylosidase